ncbi:hypothetical protein [Fusobacterium necrophorum]|uniref:hypothetical protein n=1 Tax=Fusobacterium necrophorum TaxID=859 RepID=UPI00370F6248
MKYDLIIKNGKVVSPSNTIKTDIGIINGKIFTLGDLKNFEAKKIIDASEKYVMPGVIEAHMHCMAPFQGCLGANDFFQVAPLVELLCLWILQMFLKENLFMKL